MTASRSEGSDASLLAGGGVAPPFESTSPKVPSATESAVPVKYPSTGYQASASLPTTGSPSAGIAQNPASPASSGRVAAQTGPYDTGGGSGTQADEVTPPVTPQVASSTPASTDRYGMGSTPPPVGAPPVPVQLSAANPSSAYGYPNAMQPAAPDYRSAMAQASPGSSPAATAPAAVSLPDTPGSVATGVPAAVTAGLQPPSTTRPNGNTLRGAASPAQQLATQDAPAPVVDAYPVPPPAAQVAAAPAPYRPGGTSDYSDTSLAAFNVASRAENPPVTGTTPPASQPPDRYAPSPVVPVPARY